MAVCRCPDTADEAAAHAAWCGVRGGTLVPELGRCATLGDALLAASPPLPDPAALPPPPESWWAIDPGFRSGAPGYVDPARAEDRLAALAEHPDAERVTLGVSRLGQPLTALRITAGEPDPTRPAVLVLGTTHGDELATPLFALGTAEWLLDDARAGLRASLEVWVVPVVNPDGLWTTIYQDRRGMRQGGRKNGADFLATCRPGHEARRGVDLNRNYPFAWGAAGGSSAAASAWNHRGPAPASEPETRAVMALAERRRFAAAVSFHTVGAAILSPYTIPGVENPDPDTAWAVATGLARAAPGFAVKRSLYPVDGTDQDWWFHEFGTLAYLVEGDSDNPTDPEVRDRSVARAVAVGTALLQRVAGGPRVSGVVVDAGGAPIEAVVDLGERWSAGERWTSDPRSGRFDRVVAGPGTYRVRCRRGEVVGEVSVTSTPERPIAEVTCRLPR